MRIFFVLENKKMALNCILRVPLCIGDLRQLVHLTFRAGPLKSIFMFNITSEKWSEQSGVLTGDPAPVRAYFGFGAAAGKIYVHAGAGIQSELLINTL